MTQETIDRLELVLTYPFLESCGKQMYANITPLKNWVVAATECGSRRWSNCQLIARNSLCRIVEERASERAKLWNSTVTQLRPRIVDFTDSLTSISELPVTLRRAVSGSISWDILFICMEFEYRDVVEPIFFIPYIEPWYKEGHFPCGWDGPEFPEVWDGVVREGRLMVY